MSHPGHDHGGRQEECCCQPVTCAATLDDMEFERGIWYAAQHGDLVRLEKLVERGVDLLDMSGYTALHHAARSGVTAACQLLLQHGANPNALTRAGRATPLQRACYAGHLDVVKILLDSGADLSLQDSDGQTALHRAVVGGHPEVVALLIERGATRVTDNRGRLPLHLAQQQNKNQQQLLQLLM